MAEAFVGALQWQRAQRLGKAEVVKALAAGGHVGFRFVHCGSILGFGGYLERPCVPHLCGHTLKHVIFASFWKPLGDPVGTIFRLWTHSGGFRGAQSGYPKWQEMLSLRVSLETHPLLLLP